MFSRMAAKKSSVLLQRILCTAFLLTTIFVNTGLCQGTTTSNPKDCSGGKILIASKCTDWWVVLLIVIGCIVVVVVAGWIICCCCPCCVCSCITDILCCCCKD